MDSSEKKVPSSELVLYGPVFSETTNDELYGNGILEIMVGQPETKFDVDRVVLMGVSNFFSRVFRNKNPKIKLGAMALPDEDPETFQRFLKWTYAKVNCDSRARAGVTHLEVQFRDVSREELLRLYLLAARFGARLLEDEIVSLFYDRLARGMEKMATLGIDDDFLVLLAARLGHRTALYKLLSRALAYGMATNPYHGVPYRDRAPSYLPTAANTGGTTGGQQMVRPGDVFYTPQRHPYPSNLSKAVMRYATQVLPEQFMRSIMQEFFDLHTTPIMNSFNLEVGSLEQYHVVRPFRV